MTHWGGSGRPFSAMPPDHLHFCLHAYRTGNIPVPFSDGPQWFAARVDDWVRQACSGQQWAGEDIMVLAVGGYGRSELYPYSDIDLLVCVPEGFAALSEDIAHTLFLPLWDSGLDLGHGIRTTAETRNLAGEDFVTLCAVLEARLLVGSEEQFERFQRRVQDEVVVPRRKELVSWLSRGRVQRHARFGETSHLLAPNLKEGRGGQRDLQIVRWLESICSRAGDSVFLCPEDESVLRSSASFLSAARVVLHRISGRKNDTAHLDVQPDLAQVLGFGAATERGGVEQFLSELHKAMSEIKCLCQLSLNRALAPVAPARLVEPPAEGLDFSVLAIDPSNILELFSHSAQSGIPLNWQTRRFIQSRFDVLSRAQAWRRDAAARFEKILCAPWAAAALEQMLEVGFLGVFIPEFRAIEHLVQFDAYHQFPVGPHLVETVRHLTSFSAGHEFLGDVLHFLAADPCLRWAALLHDIGKGHAGHCLRGARMAREILGSLGYDDEFCARCAFLIEHHLLLTHTATRRDLGEEAVILDLAQTVGSVGLLESLILLAWADASATGPKAWNPWIENLLRETYFKTRKMLERGFLCGEQSVHRLARIRDVLRSQRPEKFSVSCYESFLSVMPARYLLQTSTKRIVEHIEAVHAFHRDGASLFALSWEHKSKAGSFRLTLVSRDKPGLFAQVCAGLHRHGMSILGADLAVWEDGTVVDVFWVTEPLDVIYADQTLESFRATRDRLMRAEDELERLSLRVPPRLKKVFALDPELVSVKFDNTASDFYTILSVQAPDIPGLLATLSQGLFRLDMDVVAAKIATQKDKAMDIFRVRIGGEKIPEAEIPALENALRLLVCSLYA